MRKILMAATVALLGAGGSLGAMPEARAQSFEFRFGTAPRTYYDRPPGYVYAPQRPYYRPRYPIYEEEVFMRPPRCRYVKRWERTSNGRMIRRTYQVCR